MNFVCGIEKAEILFYVRIKTKSQRVYLTDSSKKKSNKTTGRQLFNIVEKVDEW